MFASECVVVVGSTAVSCAVAPTHGRTVVVPGDAELPEDLARDRTEVLTSMCARRYGRRCASWRAAVVAIENEPDHTPGDRS